MNKFNKYIYFIILSFAIIFTGCGDPDDEVTGIDYARLFSPTSFVAKVLNKVDVRLTWNHMIGANQYEVQLFENGDLNFDGTPALIHTFPVDVVNSSDNRYVVETIITGLKGETEYSARIRALGENISESRWETTTFQTEMEQIFLPVNPDELLATQVTLHWTPGATATEIILNPGDIHHTVTAGEIAAGAATITGLTGETTYTAKLMNGTKTRGTITFTTLVDLGGAEAIHPEDDLKAILDAAADGAAFVLFPGEYTIGSYEITKSLKLSGYKSNDKPIIYGQLKSGATVASLELKALIFRGNADPASILGQFFNAASGCNIQSITITDCEISNYNNNFIYNNTAGVFGSIIISGSYIHDIPGTGGDGIDFRGGTLGMLKIENTTFANGFRTFLRMQASSDVSFTNCTFYKISCLDDGNNHGLFRCSAGGTLNVSNCLFVATGKENPTNATVGNWCRNAANMAASPTYYKNFYYNCPNLWVGLYTNPSECSATEANPGFKDAENGDFTVTNIDLVGVAGDPRWW
jgi:hypothetical protein